MNDLLRPAMYEAWHGILPVSPRALVAPCSPAEVVGPVCETGDTFARDRALPALGPGELVAILDAGAYGAAMSSTYNMRPLAAEVLVDGARFAVVRDRQDHAALLAGVRVPPWLENTRMRSREGAPNASLAGASPPAGARGAALGGGVAAALAGARAARAASSSWRCSACRPCCPGRGTCCCWPASPPGSAPWSGAASGISARPTTRRPSGGWNATPASATGRWRRWPTGRRRPGDDPATLAFWRVHQARAAAQLAKLRVGAPRPGLPARDPVALRAALGLALVAALAVAGGEAPERLRRALLPEFERPAPAPSQRLEAWVTPPAYTGAAPVFLNPAGGAATVPQGSRLQVAVSGGSGAPPLLSTDAGDVPFRALDGAQLPGRNAARDRQPARRAAREPGPRRLDPVRAGRRAAHRRLRRAAGPRPAGPGRAAALAGGRRLGPRLPPRRGAAQGPAGRAAAHARTLAARRQPEQARARHRPARPVGPSLGRAGGGVPAGRPRRRRSGGPVRGRRPSPCRSAPSTTPSRGG